MSDRSRFIPAAVLGLGCLLLLRVTGQRVMPLTRPLSSLPATMQGYQGTDLTISPEEQAAAGMTSYVLRSFGPDSSTVFSVYVGYYDYQTQGKTVHSPKNCLPGAGWEPLEASEMLLGTEGVTVPINLYVLANQDQRAIVMYWYQGRGRVAANEYRVKYDLLRDAALRGRTEEALVRVFVPVTPGLNQASALELAKSVASGLVPSLKQILPS